MADAGPDCRVGLLRAHRQWIPPPSILPFASLGSSEQERRQLIEQDVCVGEPAFDEVEAYASVRQER